MGNGSTRNGNAPDRAMRGRAAMSDRKLGRAVMLDRAVQFEFPTGLPRDIRGYVCGWDAYHWYVISFAGGKSIERLVHKGQAATVTILDRTIVSESDADQQTYQEIVSSFKGWLVAEGIAVVPASSRR